MTMNEKYINDLRKEEQQWENLYILSRNNLKNARRKLLYLTDPEKLYGKYKYWARHTNMRDWEMRLGKVLVEKFKIKTMVDFGCGLGSYLEGALQGGCEKILGFDLLREMILSAIPENMREFVLFGNAGETIDCGKWDCVLSVEAAEHLVPEQADTFVDNLIRASSRLIVLTASNAGGRYHLNRQLREYWIGKLSVKCASYSDKYTKKLFKIWSHSRAPSYILKNLMVFFVNK